MKNTDEKDENDDEAAPHHDLQHGGKMHPGLIGLNQR